MTAKDDGMHDHVLAQSSLQCGLHALGEVLTRRSDIRSCQLFSSSLCSAILMEDSLTLVEIQFLGRRGFLVMKYDDVILLARIVRSGRLRFFVQEYCPGGMEVIVGAKSEEGLGHLVMFGVGGIYVEVLKDVAFKLSPVTTVEAREMLSSIKAAPLLDGVRGDAGVNQEGIIEVIGRLSQLVTELPMIQEMDLNPIIAYADRVSVVDARVSV